MKKRRIRLAKGESFSAIFPTPHGRILLPIAILLFLIRESCLGYPPEHEKCRVWFKKGHPNITKLSIDCTNVDLTSPTDVKYLNMFLETIPSPCVCLSLSLINFSYPNGSLQDDWFCNYGLLNLNIKSLRIEGGLFRIAADSFRCLPVLETLALSDTNIRHLWKRPFQNIPNLHRLELNSQNFLASADLGFLSGMTRLETLRITNMDMDQNITHNFLQNLITDELEIETVDWSNVNLGMVAPEVLSRLPKLRRMNLRSSRMRFIGAGFNKLQKLTVLELNSNDIRLVPETNRELVERLSELYLRNNPLICDCDIIWLQRYINEKKNGTFGDFRYVTCAEPEHLRNVPFLEAKMCPPPTPTKPPSGCPMIEIVCESMQNKKTKRFNLTSNGETNEDGDTVKIEEEKQNFTVIHNDATNTISIKIVNANRRKKTLLYWSNTQPRQPSYKCVTDVTEGFVVQTQYDTNYIICVFDRQEKISLSDCKPFRTAKSYSDRVWLTNEMKFTVSIITTALLLAAIVTGGGMAYFLFRHNPSLLRGSKRVITVKRYNKPTVIVMPKGYNAVDTRAQAQPVYADLCNEDTGSIASYISAIPPGPSELLEFRMQKLKKYPLPFPPP